MPSAADVVGRGMPEVRQTLLADRAETSERIAALCRDIDGVVRASADSNADDEHDPEGATIAFERAQLMALVDQAHRRLVEIDQALSRVDTDAYGTCIGCGEPIAVERLRGRPTATTCVRCATHR